MLSIRYPDEEWADAVTVSTDDNDLEYITFAPRPSRQVIEFLETAEEQSSPVVIGATGDIEGTIGWFDVDGIATNLARLPCWST